MTKPIRRVSGSLASRILTELLIQPGLTVAELRSRLKYTGNPKCFQVALARLRQQGEISTINGQNFLDGGRPYHALDRARLESIRTEAAFWRSKASLRASQVEYACAWIAGQAGKSVSPEAANEALGKIHQIESGREVSRRSLIGWLAETRKGAPGHTGTKI